MARLLVSLAVTFTVASLVVMGCAPAAPPAAPTAAPAAPTKATEPTKAPAAPAVATTAPATKTEPTKAPTAPPKVTYPEKGRAITMIVPWAAGGGTDVGARILAADMEKALGNPVPVVNKAGAASQTGTTELARSKPDGYTIGFINIPSILTTYLDPERQATYAMKDFQTIAFHVMEPHTVTVAADSRWKTLKDFVDEAKAKPGELKGTTEGILSPSHLALMALEKGAGVKISAVHFDSGGQSMTALAGGHVDAYFGQPAAAMAQIKGGQARVLAIMDKERVKALPDVKTTEEQGFKVYADVGRTVSGPAGMPKETVDTLAAAIKKITEMPDHIKKVEDMGLTLRYMGPADTAKYWADKEASAKALVLEFRAANK